LGCPGFAAGASASTYLFGGDKRSTMSIYRCLTSHPQKRWLERKEDHEIGVSTGESLVTVIIISNKLKNDL
jgi:hypothetical protein